MATFEFDTSALQNYSTRLKKSVSQAREEFIVQSVDNMGQWANSHVKTLTPVGQYSGRVDFDTRKGRHVGFNTAPRMGGHLRRSWHTSNVRSEGSSASIDVINDASIMRNPQHPLATGHGIYYYAEDVEEGHMATTLDRIPDETAQGIVRPVAKTPVEGTHMMEMTLQELERTYRPKLAQEFHDYIQSITGGE